MAKSYLRFWGVRGSYTAPFKTHLGVGGNTPFVEINVDGHLLICDAGTGIIPLGNKLVGEGKQDSLLILLSHFHWDHISGLPFFTPAFIPKYNINFFGPGDSAEIIKKYIDKRNLYSSYLMSYAEKRVMRFQIDKDWREHLAAMDMLRGSVNLRAMGGKDPFYEYKRESFDYFDEMLSNQNEKVLKTLFNLELVTANKDNNNVKKVKSAKTLISKKIGRNEPCPCGSGKKYKICHGS